MIDSLVRVIEFVFQGSLVLFVIWYALHEAECFKIWVRKLFGMFRTRFRVETAVLIGVVAGGSYALGILTNLWIYDLFQPQHEQIIKATQEDHYWLPKELRLYLSPFFIIYRPRANPEEEQHARIKSMCQEIAWANQKREVEQAALEPIDKELRISRGALLFSMLFFWVNLCKSCWRLFLVWKMRNGNKVTVNTGGSSRSYKRRTATQTKRWLPLAFCVVSGFVYWISFRAWADSEVRYHTFVRLGAQTAFSPSSTTDGTEKTESSKTGKTESHSKGLLHNSEIKSSSKIFSSRTSPSSWDDICKNIK